jgi:Tol biopolymer transport system component
MTTEGRLTRDLPEILGDLAAGPYPDYIDDVLASSEHVRQRPAWMFPERWLPMVDIVRQPVMVARLPWRSIALVTLLLAMVVAAAAVYIGSQQRVPAPFGLARNGLIAYEAGGDIFTADPKTSAATRILAGPEIDVAPRFSLDGTRVAFERRVDLTSSQIHVARADGTNLTLVTPEPLRLAPGDSGRAWEKYEFSPDGRTLLIATMTVGVPSMAIAQTDGSGLRQLEVGMIATEPSFRPPDGKEVLFIGTDNARRGLFAVDPATNQVRRILLVPDGFDLAGASWSPDGTRIAYWSWGGPAEGLNARSHVVAADGTGDKELPSPPGAVWNAHATWSNDGTRLFTARAYTPGYEDVRGAIVPADGSGVGVEVTRAGVETACCAAWIWSPDDLYLLGRTAGIEGTPTSMIIDVSGGPVRPAPWASISDPTWQRLAP